jgi:signal peptidase I
LKKILLVFFLAALLTLILLHFFFSAFTVRGDSMKPTLLAGERIILWKWKAAGNLKRFDLVVFYQPDAPDKLLVKRVIGLPQETIAISGSRILINGRVLNENFSDQLRYDVYQDMDALRIPRSHFFVMGDNRFLSVDSRIFGVVGERYLLGKVVWRYWPFKRLGGVR